ncbi:MAG: hypothetical protein RR194_02480, partial [Ruthenibacterium sp.]
SPVQMFVKLLVQLLSCYKKWEQALQNPVMACGCAKRKRACKALPRINPPREKPPRVNPLRKK